MLTIERRPSIEVEPICRVVGLGWREVEERIQRWICGLGLAANIEVAGTERGILIRVCTYQAEAAGYVHPEDYVNHNDPWARRNPSLAAVTTGLIEILS